MSPADLMAYLAMAAQLAGYETPADPPHIIWAPQSTLVSWACPGGCPIGALQSGGTLYLTPGAPADVVIHELVHYAQWVTDGEAAGCEERHRREREACAAQQAYRLSAADYSPLRPRHYNCEEIRDE